MKTAYLSLGSNLGDREANLRAAIQRLESAGVRVLRRSSVYETEPQELRDQPWFLNLVAEVGIHMPPEELLGRIHEIETELGRSRVVAKGPRSIDIDILLYDNDAVEAEELQIPHPRLAQRRFVLEPLAELVPELLHPGTGKSIREMLAAVQDQVVRRTGIRL